MKHVNSPAEYRNQMMIRLMKGPCFIVYKTTKGKVSRVLCTLHNQLLPRNVPVEHDRSKKYWHAHDENRMVVWDLQNRIWRSFIVENVKFFEELNKTPDEKERK